jgi:exosortase
MTTDPQSTTAKAAPHPARLEWTLAGILVAATIAVYFPILKSMVRHWGISPDYSHGFLIPILAIYFAFERNKKLRRAPVATDFLGIAPLILGTLTLAIGRFGVELMNMRASFVFTLIGIVLLVLGRRVFQILAFPLCFLFLMVPLPQSLVNTIAFPLQLIAADAATEFMQWIGIPALREGNILHLAKSQLFVEEACSGLRSLMALVTLGVVFAYFFRKNWVERLVIVASAIPIAIAVNAFRVALTGVLTHHIGVEAAGGWIHQTEGFFTFGIAFFLLLGEAALLQRFWPRAKKEASA